jgi:hypothetical protein
MFDKYSDIHRNIAASIDGNENEMTVNEPEYRAFPANVNVEEDYYSVVGRMQDIYAAKNADYGNSFEMTLDKYGIIGAIIRMQDKMNRIDGYYWKADEEKLVDESLIDTLEDLGNYAIMTSVWLRNQ